MATPAPQLGFDEMVVEDQTVERLLEARQKALEKLKPLRKAYRDAHEAAKAAASTLTIPEEGAIRIGRFRIASKTVKGRAVEFETSDRTQLRFSLADEETPRLKAL